MEGGGVSSVSALSMDCEDMFKEITKKLYGEEATVGVGVGVSGSVSVGGVEFPAAERDLDEDLRPEEHITAWGLAALMQNGFPPPGILQPNFRPRTEGATTGEDRWAAAEEPLSWAHSRVAAYNSAQRLFKCCECECVGFLARIAEHWLGRHSAARVFHCPAAGCGFASGWARAVRYHLQRDHHADPAAADHLLRDNPALDDLTRYLTKLKNKVEAARTDRRTVSGSGGNGETVSTESATGGGGAGAGGGGDGGKRYACGACPYATDRRDLYTRHENIHRDEKPFHCYLCQKQFNRADHVKKHFLRMHRDQPYDLNRIRRATGKPSPQHPPAAATPHYYKPPGEPPPPAPAPPPLVPPPLAPPSLEYRSPPVKLERAPLAKAEPGVEQKAGVAVGATIAGGAASRRKGERRYACCYCAWSGVDNWCLKRHLNTHLKPFACALCEYKAARAERLATHVHKVHNKKACGKCPYLADDAPHLAAHLRDAHHIENRNLKVPTSVSRGAGGAAAGAGAGASVLSGGFASGGGATAGASGVGGGEEAGASGGARRREQRPAGAARLFGYLEASDGSGDEYDAPPALPDEYVQPGPAAAPSAPSVPLAPAPPLYARDKENAAPLHHALHHDHCLRY